MGLDGGLKLFGPKAQQGYRLYLTLRVYSHGTSLMRLKQRGDRDYPGNAQNIILMRPLAGGPTGHKLEDNITVGGFGRCAQSFYCVGVEKG